MSDTVLMNEKAYKNYADCFEPFFISGPVKVFRFKARTNAF
jgi:hypothetical protein